MFERRLKIFLVLLVLLSVALMVRAFVVQVVRHNYWTQEASGLLETNSTTETTRGEILDCHGVVLADDQPCTDAAVDYRAIISPPDPDWVAEISADRLREQMGPTVWKHTPRIQRKQLVFAESVQTRADIKRMWRKLALFYNPADAHDASDPQSAIADLRAGIVQQVQMQRRWLWFTHYQRNKRKVAELPRWQRWLMGGSGPNIDNFAVEVDEQKRPHVILPAVTPAVANYLGKRLEQFPGLVLQPSVRRQYPLAITACHLLGRMSRVDRADVLKSREAGIGPARRYNGNDEIGRAGIEALCEPLLRGSRGEIQRQAGTDDILSQTPFVPGQNVRLTIDSVLQHNIQDVFHEFPVTYRKPNGGNQRLELHDMHGAAVVIDIPTGNVLALVSSPDFNLDKLDDNYRKLIDDRLNAPLRDRATSDQLEPGSSVKPMVGLAGITQGVIGPYEGIECTGYLYLPVLGPDGKPTGRKQRQIGGRCWVASEYGRALLAMNPPIKPIHHVIPFYDPHRGKYGNPDGWLAFCDALERSCNIFFETTADRLGRVNLCNWYKKFGFGRKTGVGIFEEPGRRPDQFPDLAIMRRMTNCFAGIGQGRVWATPLQIANEAATVARGGIWMRPRLLNVQQQTRLNAVDPPPADAPPDRVDLHIDPVGLALAKIGMENVVYQLAGTGRTLYYTDAGTAADVHDETPDPLLEGIKLAGKTGTAQAAPLWETKRDPYGKPVLDPKTGKPIREPLKPSTAAGGENPTAPWYWSTDDEGTQFVHAWFMGYAPADHPKIAFAVLVEYSPTGGGSASGYIARHILEQCVKRGYLHPLPALNE